jgi:predicted nucleic acid-binding protein
MFLDSNVFIHLYEADGKKGAECSRLFKRIAAGEQNAVTSPLVFDEVIYYFLDVRGLPFVEKIWRHMTTLSHLEVLPVDEKVTEHVMKFVKAGMAPRDAFHAATMYANGVDTICSYDKGFDHVPSIKRQEPR